MALDALKISKDALISDCETFRYWLTRTWDVTLPRLVFVGLNPSTADATLDDPTIRRCIGFSRREGFGGITMLNLFAYRATDPKELEGAAWGKDIRGPNNDFYHGYYLQQALIHNIPVVCAWGANKAVGDEGKAFVQRALQMGNNVVCLGQTQSGAPKHPLYIAADKPLVPYVCA